jgi:uncharacterized protein YbaR (Trm112 family)
MQKYYVCPNCRGHLMVGDYIILSAQNQQSKRGLLLLHPEIGNYSSLKHPSFKYKIGDLIDFFCPMCQHYLQSKFDKNLVHVIMIDTDKKEYDVYFSRIAGEQSTYQVSGEKTISATGEHSHRYTYFKIPEELKKYL